MMTEESDFVGHEVEKKEKKRQKINVIAINNAATDALIEVGIDKDHHICPTSSVCDAQGSFGSCPPHKTISNREFYPMDFTIKNRDESIFYHGRTELKKKGRITEAKITFSSEVNNFFLPEVQIDIDITEKHAINVLGANESYKELLNTIVSIWARIFKKNRLMNSHQICYGKHYKGILYLLNLYQPVLLKVWAIYFKKLILSLNSLVMIVVELLQEPN
jgi:hypothetical protein